MSAAMPRGMRRPPPLRQVSDTRWRLQAALSDGRLMKFGDGHMCLEFFLSPWGQATLSGGGSTFDTAVHSRLGPILTDGEAAAWHLLGGVPLPAVAASQEERQLRLSLALAHAPVELTRVIGPLSPASLDVMSAGAEEALELMWRITREDVTIYARACAPPGVWMALLQSLPDLSEEPVLAAPAPHIYRPNEVVSIRVAIAYGDLSPLAIARLQPRDVVRLSTSFDVSGRGRLRLHEFEYDVQWRTRSPLHEFEVVEPHSAGAPVIGAAPGSLEGTPHTLELLNMNNAGADAPDQFATDQFAGEAMPHGYADGVQAYGEAPPESAWSQMPVTLVAEIGTLTTTLGNLSQLRPGALIKLSGRSEDEVVLRAIDGPPVAYAELVDIGGHLGMQVTRVVGS